MKLFLYTYLYRENEETAASMVISSQISKGFINLPPNSPVRLEFDSVSEFVQTVLCTMMLYLPMNVCTYTGII